MKAVLGMKLIDKIKSNSFAMDSFWAVAGNIVAKGASILGVILIARILGKDLYGEFGSVKNTLTNIAIFSSLGFGYTSTKFVSEYLYDKKEYIGALSKFVINFTFLVSLVTSIFLFFLADFVSNKMVGDDSLVLYLKLLSVWVIFYTVTVVQIGILAGYKAFKEMAKINLIVGVFGFIASVALTYYYMLIGALIALLLTQIVNFSANFILCRKKIQKSDKKISIQEKWNLLKFTFPISLQESVYALSSWLSVVLLLKYGNYGDVGLYSAAIQWSVVILFVPGILRNVILTHLSGNLKNVESHNKILKRTLILNLVLTLTPTVIVALLSSFIAGFYGKTYEGLQIVLVTVVTSTIFMSMSNVYAQAYMSKDKNWLMLFFRLIKDFGALLLFVNLNRSFTNVPLNMACSVLIMNIIFLFIIAGFYRRII
ncbi:oligosaccharide flippase family protein [Aquimarina agarivorans]|uniref:oligosaccharide flippase family protein n=1 Tax=Aquimarina agarivorans TaxID=980584 RepID=UPI000248EB62|nr:oligosaccharide flippase family protein [Aquimarina agarivorans]